MHSFEGALLTFAAPIDLAGKANNSSAVRAYPPEMEAWESGARPKAIDLFAGAGGFSLGALLAGTDVVAAVEKDQSASTTYAWNLIHTQLTKTRLFQQDILDLDPKVLMAESPSAKFTMIFCALRFCAA